MSKKVKIYATNNKETVYCCSSGAKTLNKGIEMFVKNYGKFYKGRVEGKKFIVKNKPCFFSKIKNIEYFEARYK